MSNLENPQARVLAHLMGGLSEDCFCAAWFNGCEYALWADLTGEEVGGKQGWKITPEEKEELQLLHELAGGWIVWSEEIGGLQFLPTSEWLQHIATMELQRR